MLLLGTTLMVVTDAFNDTQWDTGERTTTYGAGFYLLTVACLAGTRRDRDDRPGHPPPRRDLPRARTVLAVPAAAAAAAALADPAAAARAALAGRARPPAVPAGPASGPARTAPGLKFLLGVSGVSHHSPRACATLP